MLWPMADDCQHPNRKPQQTVYNQIFDYCPDCGEQWIERDEDDEPTLGERVLQALVVSFVEEGDSWQLTKSLPADSIELRHLERLISEARPKPPT